MQIDYHKRFKKQYEKLSLKVRERFKERLRIFSANAFVVELNNHSLHGKYQGCRSINVTGDLRAIYEILKDRVRFLEIGTHSDLY